MLNYVLRPVLHHQFNRKYASKKYLKVCLFWICCYYRTDSRSLILGECVREGMGFELLGRGPVRFIER